MFRSCLAQASRSLGSTSSSAYIQTSAVLRSKADDISRRLRREQKLQKRAEDLANRPSPVLGVSPGNEIKWQTSDLAKVLVDESEFDNPPEPTIIQTAVGEVSIPKHLAYGISEEEKSLLFNKLPEVSSTRTVVNRDVVESAALKIMQQTEGSQEAKKVGLFAMAVDLRNANASGIHYENRQRIIREFSTPENPYDPGRIEVQAAILTYRIRNMWQHMTSRQHRKDVASKRRLRFLVYQRARTLKYLKRVDRVRYDIALQRMGLEPGSVEGELMV